MRRWAPWAYKIARSGDIGCIAFEDEDDYRRWVDGGRVFPTTKILDRIPPEYKGRLFYCQVQIPQFALPLAKWRVSDVVKCEGGYMVFERHEDVKTWRETGMPFIDQKGVRREY